MLTCYAVLRLCCVLICVKLMFRKVRFIHFCCQTWILIKFSSVNRRPWKTIKKQQRVILVLADDSFYFSPGQSENLQSALLKLYKATHLPVKHVLMRVSAVVMSSCTLMLISLDGKGHQGRRIDFQPHDLTWKAETWSSRINP